MKLQTFKSAAKLDQSASLARPIDPLGACPQCGIMMTAGMSDAHRASRDHILPKSRGGTIFIHGNTRNTRVMCQDCNGSLSACLQCVGAMACARSVSVDSGFSIKRVLRRWRFGRLVTDCTKQPVAKRRTNYRENFARAAADVWKAEKPTLADLFPSQVRGIEPCRSAEQC